MKVNKTI